MQITSFSDYALRVLMFLAVCGDEKVSSREIAERHGLSVEHVAKITQFLSREGFVIATRGRGGGLRLARAPADISIGDVLRRSEAGSGPVECLRGGPVSCVLAPICGLTPIFAEASEAFFKSLDARTLAETVARPERMRARLKLSQTDTV
jgi:Rrf2 family nitric oxide-sensitive transcriptional repressor